MKQLYVWVFSALLFAAIGGLAVWTSMARSGEEHESTERAASAPTGSEPPVLSRDKDGAVVVRLETEVQQRIGLQTRPLQQATDEPEVVAYGTVQEDPAGVFMIRAPLAGTVLSAEGGKWASLGQPIAKDTTVGSLAPRFGPIEQADLASKLAVAEADVQSARASLAALQASLESKRTLNTGQQKIVSDQVLQEAEAKVKGEEARLKAAQATVRVLQAWATSSSQPAGGILPLIAGSAGRVVEVLVQPGEAVEAGQGIVKVASYERLFARVSLPAGEALNRVGSARIVVAGDQKHPFAGEEHVATAAADPTTGGQTFMFPFRPEAAAVQPGMPVVAHIKTSGEPAQGVMVPREAVVRYLGAGWVYVKQGDESFVRREIPLSRSSLQGWFVPAGTLSSGDEVVVQAAQSLLSHELKFQTGGGGEEEE